MKQWKKMTKPNIKQQASRCRKRCVLLAKAIVRKDKGCIYCKRKKPEVAVHAHHIYNETAHKYMSAELSNLVPVCFTHHSSTWQTKEPSFHRNPQEMSDFMRENYPELMEKLRADKNASIEFEAKLDKLTPVERDKFDLSFWQEKETLLKTIYQTQNEKPKISQTIRRNKRITR